MSGFLSRLLYRAGIANAADEQISLLRYRSPARFEPAGPEPAALEEGVVTPPIVQPGIRASLDLKAPAGPSGTPVRVPGSSIGFDAAPSRSTEAAAPPAHPILMQDRRPRFEGHSPEAPAAPASIAVPPTLPPTAPGNADQRPLKPHQQPVRQREVPPEARLPSKAPQPSASASGVRLIETPPALNTLSPQQTESQPETIIQIDRVEIVASQPEPRRTIAPVSRKPTTSLADYLARRRR